MVGTPSSTNSLKASNSTKPKRKPASGVLAPKVGTGKTIFAMNFK
jgi:hypothetical protein